MQVPDGAAIVSLCRLMLARVGLGLLFALDTIRMALSLKRQDDVCIIVRVDNIGDFVLWLDAATYLREHYRSMRMVAVVELSAADLAQRCGVFDDVIAIDTKRFIRNPIYRWKTLRNIQHRNPAIAIQPTYSRVFLTGDSIIRVSGAKERIGFSGDLSNMSAWQRSVSDRWYTQLIPASSDTLMEIDRNLEFLRGLGIVTSEARVARLPIMAELPGTLRIEDDYFVVFPGASWVGRMWPVASFASVSKAIYEQYGWRMVVCGGEREMTLGDDLLNAAELADSVNFSGRTSLAEFIEIVRGARLLVGNDTSAVHIAASVDTPVVCILGGGHFGRFLPYSAAIVGTHPACVHLSMPCFGCNWRCTQSRRHGYCVPCIENVPVGDVVAMVDQVLKRNRIAPHSLRLR